MCVVVNDFARAPMVAVARTAFTPIGEPFIKRTGAGKNERFHSPHRTRGETPVGGHEIQPRRSAPRHSEAHSADLIKKLCVNAQSKAELLTKFCSSLEAAHGIQAQHMKLNEVSVENCRRRLGLLTRRLLTDLLHLGASCPRQGDPRFGVRRVARRLAPKQFAVTHRPGRSVAYWAPASEPVDNRL